MKQLGLVIPLLAFALTGCKQKALTRAEASEALEESQLATQAASLTSGTVEIGTNFTIGDAAEAAADELRTFYQDQLPCADVSLEGVTLTIEYGAHGTCLYRGQTYKGRHMVTVSKNDMDDVVVDHAWQDLQNDTLRVNGTATVTWSFDDPSRRVQHELEWERLSDGKTGVGSGDRVQRPLENGVAEGFSVSGTRHWQGETGTWTLSINDVEMRWVDPVPQAGSYSLDTPFDKQLALGFERVDATTIQVSVSSGEKRFDFDVETLAD